VNAESHVVRSSTYMVVRLTAHHMMFVVVAPKDESQKLVLVSCTNIKNVIQSVLFCHCLTF
jgi:hypothetical protein